MTLWQGVIKQAYEAAGGEDADQNKITVLEVPEPVKEVRSEGNDSAKEPIGTAPVTDSAMKTPSLEPTPKEKIRHEWYQSGRSVDISLFAAGVDKTKIEVTFEERGVSNFLPILNTVLTLNSSR